MGFGVGRVAEVLTDDVKDYRDYRRHDDRAPILESPFGNGHERLRQLNDLAERDIRNAESDVGEEHLVRNVRRDLRCGEGHDDGRHEREDVPDGKAQYRRTETARREVIFPVAYDDDLCSDKVRDEEPARYGQGEDHRPEARRQNEHEHRNDERVRHVADDVVNLGHNEVDFFGKAPDGADDDADNEVDRGAHERKRDRNARAVPQRVERRLADVARAEDPAETEPEALYRRRRQKVPRVEFFRVDVIHRLGICGVAGDQRVYVCKYDHEREKRQDDDIDLLFEEDSEHRFPIGISRRRDFFGFVEAVVVVREQFFFRHSEVFKVYKFVVHLYLPFVENEILGSIIAIRISPRISDKTESIA